MTDTTVPPRLTEDPEASARFARAVHDKRRGPDIPSSSRDRFQHGGATAVGEAAATDSAETTVGDLIDESVVEVIGWVARTRRFLRTTVRKARVVARATGNTAFTAGRGVAQAAKASGRGLARVFYWIGQAVYRSAWFVGVGALGVLGGIAAALWLLIMALAVALSYVLFALMRLFHAVGLLLAAPHLALQRDGSLQGVWDEFLGGLRIEGFHLMDLQALDVRSRLSTPTVVESVTSQDPRAKTGPTPRRRPRRVPRMPDTAMA